MHVYKQNQNLDSSLPSADRPDQWVHARLGEKFKLTHVQIGANLNTARLDYALDLEKGAVRQQEIRDPLHLDNLIGITVLDHNHTTRGVVFPTDLSGGDWVTQAGSAPGITYTSGKVGFTIPSVKDAKLRTMTHILVRVGDANSSWTISGADTLREFSETDNLQGTMVGELLLPLVHTYVPPVPSATNPNGTTRGTGDEHSFYNLGTASFTLGLRITQKANGQKIVEAISNNSTAVPENLIITFNVVRGIGG